MGKSRDPPFQVEDAEEELLWKLAKPLRQDAKCVSFSRERERARVRKRKKEKEKKEGV